MKTWVSLPILMFPDVAPGHRHRARAAVGLAEGATALDVGNVDEGG